MAKEKFIFRVRDQWTAWPEYRSVRLGPRFSKFCWSWSGSVRYVRKRFGTGPSWSLISQFYSTLVRSLDPCVGLAKIYTRSYPCWLPVFLANKISSRLVICKNSGFSNRSSSVISSKNLFDFVTDL